MLQHNPGPNCRFVSSITVRRQILFYSLFYSRFASYFTLKCHHHVCFLPLQLSYCSLIWEEDAIPWLCRFTAESHEAHAPARPGSVNRRGKKKKKKAKKLTVTLCLYSILSTDHHSLSFSAPFLSQFDGQRNKLVACDGNEIDTMFVDRRRDGGQKSQTLVNVCNDLLFLKPWASFRVQQNLSHQSLFIWVLKCMNSATGHLL